MNQSGQPDASIWNQIFFILDPIKLQQLVEDYLDLMTHNHTKKATLLNPNTELFEFKIKPKNSILQDKEKKLETKVTSIEDTIQVNDKINRKNSIQNNEQSNKGKQNKVN